MSDLMELYKSDPDHTQTAVEYLPDICDNLYRTQKKLPHYMDQQPEINGKMREILVDWLAEVSGAYRMRSETLFLTVNLLDRFLSRLRVARKNLQLVGVVALLIAAKFEEVDPPSVESLAYSTDRAYTVQEILQFECKFLTIMGFQILVPTAAHFLERLRRFNQCDKDHHRLAKHILELSLLDLNMHRHEPSRLCASAVFLSNELLGRPTPWPASMADASRHAESSLRECVEELRAIWEAAPTNQLQAIQKKYASSSAKWSHQGA